MNVLCIGDVVGEAGVDFFASRLPSLKRELFADFVIVNGENSDKSGIGLNKHTAETLLQYADVVTGGNHSLRRASLGLYAENECLLLPANQPCTSDDMGCCVLNTGRLGDICVINLAGCAWMEPLCNPFLRAEELLAKHSARFIIVDFHAESTAEKKALAYHLDGRVSAVFGTHTHVQTADEQLLPSGTGYISDIGMCGPSNSVIGVEPHLAVKRQREHLPVRFEVAQGPCEMRGALFILDDDTGLCLDVQRVCVT